MTRPTYVYLNVSVSGWWLLSHMNTRHDPFENTKDWVHIFHLSRMLFQVQMCLNKTKPVTGVYKAKEEKKVRHSTDS